MISNLRVICDEMIRANELDEVARIVATNSSPTGSPCRFFLGRAHRGRNQSPIANFGFQLDPPQLGIYGEHIASRLCNERIQSDSIVFVSHDSNYSQTYESLLGEVDHKSWQTTVVMPLSLKFYAALTLDLEISETDENVDYFNIIRSIVTVYLNWNSTSSQSPRFLGKKRSVRKESLNLTERQGVILEMIQEGKTNKLIAHRMGYSESLIRQESMVIYRKLGIRGRSDLKIQS